MRTLVLLLSCVWLLTSCEPAERLSFPSGQFPPKTAEELRLWIQALAPIEIPSSASDIQAVRVPRPSTSYSNLATFFFAFRCSNTEAEQVIRKESPHDNSVVVDPKRVTVTKDDTEGEDRPQVMPSRFREPPIFPDVFYEKHDLNKCTLLQIRVKRAPEWYSPQLMKRGLADRCSWKRGQIHSELYFDADRHIMFLRFDQLRPG